MLAASAPRNDRLSADQEECEHFILILIVNGALAFHAQPREVQRHSISAVGIGRIGHLCSPIGHRTPMVAEAAEESILRGRGLTA